MKEKSTDSTIAGKESTIKPNFSKTIKKHYNKEDDHKDKVNNNSVISLEEKSVDLLRENQTHLFIRENQYNRLLKELLTQEVHMEVHQGMVVTANIDFDHIF